MKKIIIASALIVSFAFTANDALPEKELDKALVGIWKGFEIDQQIQGVEKHWIVNRSKDGTFYIMFTMKEDCEIETSIEKGKWWIEKGKFYEYHEESKITDIYTYQASDGRMVRFKSVKLLNEDNNTYEFSDYRLE